MSSYMYFFVRSKTQMLPIRTVSRSHPLYQAFKRYSPYEQVEVLSRAAFDGVEHTLNDEIETSRARIKSLREQIAVVAQFNNPVDEKIDTIDAIQGDIDELNESIEGFEQAKLFINFLGHIYEEAEDTKWEEDPVKKIDSTHYLYVGIDCGIPTIKEVEEWEKK